MYLFTGKSLSLSLSLSMYIYIYRERDYIYMCVCVCVCLCDMSIKARLKISYVKLRHEFLSCFILFYIWNILVCSAQSTKFYWFRTVLALNLNYRPSNLVDRVFGNGPGDLGSFPGRIIPKTQKMVFVSALLNSQHYKVRIKGKWSIPGKRVAPSTTLQCSS